MSNVAPVPSSASNGFFQAKPKLENQFHEDASYRRVLDFFLPAAARKELSGPLSEFGDKVLSQQMLLWMQNAENHPPTLVLRDSFGSPRNELVTSEGWRQTQDFGLREGIVAAGYENAHGIHTRIVSTWEWLFLHEMLLSLVKTLKTLQSRSSKKSIPSGYRST